MSMSEVFEDLHFDKWAFRVAMAKQKIAEYQDVARLAGIPLTSLRQYLRGIVPSAVMRQKIAAALKVAECELWPRVVRADQTQGVNS